MPEIREEFVRNHADLKRRTGLPMTTVAGHGDFANRRLGVVNHELLDAAVRERSGIDLDVYDPELRSRSTNISDRSPPIGWSEPPSTAIESGVALIQLVTHPRHWGRRFVANTKENADRVWEGFGYSLPSRAVPFAPAVGSATEGTAVTDAPPDGTFEESSGSAVARFARSGYDQADITTQYDTALDTWIATARRQEAASGRLFLRLLPLLNVGPDDPVLEVGAGVGQLTRIACEQGYSVTASDVVQSFLDYMKESGIPTMKIDARHIGEPNTWAAIFTQGLSPIITRDLITVRETYESIHSALRPGGRFLLILPRGDQTRFSRASEHRGIYTDAGFTEVAAFRQQLLPAKFYRYRGVGLAESLGGRLRGVRDIRVLQK
jgi:SAM-dependent methyltransferase